jgi:predicted GNAT family N-acyltransferase
MFEGQREAQLSGFRKIAFSEKVWRCLKRADRQSYQIIQTDRETIFEQLNVIRRTLNIATNDVVARLLDRNPHIIQLAKPSASSQQPSLLAILPLNESGLAAIAEGHFSGTSPDPEWICRRHEKASAIYVWLVHMPGSFGRLLSAIAAAIDPMVTDPCPMFSKSVSGHSDRLHDGAGFLPASSFYPKAASDLLVVFPQKSLTKAPKQKLEVRIARTIEDIFQVFSVRSATYIAEQFCLYSEEFDGNDFCATQFVGTVDGDPAGCVRLRFFNGFAKLERLAVRAEYRNSRLAYQLVRAALEHCRLKGYTKVLGHSRLDLVRFWRVFGFQPIENRAPFAFANVQYVEILLNQTPDETAVEMDAAPLVIIRPEGAWDKPGPFDLSKSATDPRRRRLINEKTRTLKRQNILA